MTSAISNDTVSYETIFKGGWLEKNGKALNALILTQDLELRSISDKDRDHYTELYTDPETMKMFLDNEERLSKMSLEDWKKEQMTRIAKRVDVLIGRWKEGIPFSAFSIYHRQTGEFVGYVVAGFGDRPGESEIAYIIHKRNWHKGFGSQAVGAVVQQWMPYLQKQGYKTEGKVDGVMVSKEVCHLVATSRKDNDYSNRILAKNGFTVTGENMAYGCLRNIYERGIGIQQT